MDYKDAWEKLTLYIQGASEYLEIMAKKYDDPRIEGKLDGVMLIKGRMLEIESEDRG